MAKGKTAAVQYHGSTTVNNRWLLPAALFVEELTVLRDQHGNKLPVLRVFGGMNVLFLGAPAQPADVAHAQTAGSGLLPGAGDSVSIERSV